MVDILWAACVWYARHHLAARFSLEKRTNMRIAVLAFALAVTAPFATAVPKHQDYPLTVEVLKSEDLSTQSTRQYTLPGSPERTHCWISGWDLVCTKTPGTPPQTYDWSKRNGETSSNALIDGKPAILNCAGNKCPILEEGEYRARWTDEGHGRVELRTADFRGREKRNTFTVGYATCDLFSMMAKDGRCVEIHSDSSTNQSPILHERSSPASPEIRELDGTWKGAWRSTSFSASGTAVMTIHTQGTNVSVEIRLTGSSLKRETLSGNASTIEDGWQVTLKTVGGDLIAKGVFKGGAFLGDYDYSPLRDHGNWGLEKE